MRLSEERELTEEEQMLKVQILAAEKEKLWGGPTDDKKRAQLEKELSGEIAAELLPEVSSLKQLKPAQKGKRKIEEGERVSGQRRSREYNDEEELIDVISWIHQPGVLLRNFLGFWFFALEFLFCPKLGIPQYSWLCLGFSLPPPGGCEAQCRTARPADQHHTQCVLTQTGPARSSCLQRK